MRHAIRDSWWWRWLALFHLYLFISFYTIPLQQQTFQLSIQWWGGLLLLPHIEFVFTMATAAATKREMREKLRHKNLLSKSTFPFKMWTHFVLILPSHSKFTTYSVMLMIFFLLSMRKHAKHDPKHFEWCIAWDIFEWW